MRTQKETDLQEEVERLTKQIELEKDLRQPSPLKDVDTFTSDSTATEKENGDE